MITTSENKIVREGKIKGDLNFFNLHCYDESGISSSGTVVQHGIWIYPH